MAAAIFPDTQRLCTEQLMASDNSPHKCIYIIFVIFFME